VEAFKAILIRNIQPEKQRSTISNGDIALFRDSTKIAYLHINTNAKDPFVNFYSGSLNFGFRLTYGIGMFIVNLP